MKSLISFILLFLSSLVYSQNSDWVYRNPLPQNDFYGIKFFDQNTGYVVGSNGIILKNTTGSNNWATINGNTINDLYGIYFFDVNHGYIVGAGGLIMNTTDGGATWTHIVADNRYALRSITFVNQNTGFMAGDQGELYRTTIGMYGWIRQPATTSNLRCVFALDSLRIFACGDSGTFLRSTDGGSSWTVQTITASNLLSVNFVNSSTGFVSADPYPNLKTTDGGNTWNQFNFNASGPIYSIKFINQNTGFAVGTNGPLQKTMDGGANWLTWCSGQLFSGNTFLDISVIDSGHAFTCGTRGWILKSVDTTGNLNGQYSVPLGGNRYQLSSISFLNENTGEIIGNSQYLYTTNGGLNWTINLVGSNSWFEGGGSINGARLFSPNSGYRTQYFGGMGFNINSIENSTDGGLTWNGPRSFGVMNGFPFPGFCEAGGVTYLVVNYRLVLKNSGSGWDTALYTPYNLGQINFINANTGAVLGGSTVEGVTRTTNGGGNWSFAPFGIEHRGNDIQLLPSGVGYVAGDSNFVMKTYDYGANWTLLSVNGNLHIANIFFASDNTGWYLGQTGSYPNYDGRLYYTPNGGTNFVQLQSLQNFNVTGFSFVDISTGYVCGDSGVVLKTTNGGLTFINTTSSNLPDKFLLRQNFPNPFNPVTKIKFDIPPVGQRHAFDTKLIIYDVLGREVATLINQQMQPGSYSVDWDGTNYPSGVYFYRLEAGDYIQSKKMILIK